MTIKDAKVLVFGSGISGIGASQLLLEKGAQVVLYDGNTNQDIMKIKELVGNDTLEVILGELSQEVLESLDLVVLSPGVPTDLPIVNKMREMNLSIWGEIELAYHYDQGQILALTGTNGKTTTTALLGDIMRAHQSQVFVVGNIGNPYTQVVGDTSPQSVSVAELSSFQLETVHTFCPKVCGVLNLSPDHLNRHHTMEAYIQAKFNIAMNQKENHVCVLNYEDERLREFGETCTGNVLYFSSQRKLDVGMYLDGTKIIYSMDEDLILCSTDELKILGVHNYENVMMASLMALSYGVPLETVRSAVLQYQGVEHRIEFVCERDGITFYNDSKATNCDAAIKGIQAMIRPTILIAGGYDKDSSYDEWVDAFDGKVKTLILTGETKEKIGKVAKEAGVKEIILTDTFEEAANTALTKAMAGDAVLLSPACASWGQFKNFEERGDKFKLIMKGE